MLSGGGVDQDRDKDLDYWNAPDRLRRKNPLFEVYPENWDTVQLFLRLQTQWRISPMGQRVGLDYLAITPVASLLDIELNPDRFTDIQLMEIAILNGQ